MKTRKLLLASSILFVTAPMMTLISCASENDKNVTVSSLNQIIESIDYKNETHGENRKIELYERTAKEGNFDLDMMLTLGVKFQIPELNDGTTLRYKLERTEDFVFYEKAKYKVTITAVNKDLVSTEKIIIDFVSINEYDLKVEVNTNMINFKTQSNYQSSKTSTEIDAIVDAYPPIFEDTATGIKYEDIFFMGSLTENSIFEELGIDLALPDLAKTPYSIYKFALYKNNLTIGQKHSYSITIYCKGNHSDSSILKYVTELRFHKTFTFESADVLEETDAIALVDNVYQAYEADARFKTIANTSQAAKSWAQVDRTTDNQFGPAGTGIAGSGAGARLSIKNSDTGLDYDVANAVRDLKQKGVKVAYEYPKEEIVPDETDTDDDWVITPSTSTTSTTPLLVGKLKIRFTINGLDARHEKTSVLKFRSSNVATLTESLDYYQFQSFRDYNSKTPLVSSKTGDELYDVLKNTTMPPILNNGIQNKLSNNLSDIPPFVSVLGLDDNRDFIVRYRLNFQTMSLKQTSINTRWYQIFSTDIGGILKGKTGYQFTLKVDLVNPSTEAYANKPAFFVVKSKDYVGLDGEIKNEVTND